MTTFAPAYFDYMSSAVSADVRTVTLTNESSLMASQRPILLAKIFGIYKLVFKKVAKDKERSVKSKHTQMNLLVMENLFYKQKVSRTFDLKGIQGRKVKADGKSNGKRTLFDGEWIEGMLFRTKVEQCY